MTSLLGAGLALAVIGSAFVLISRNGPRPEELTDAGRAYNRAADITARVMQKIGLSLLLVWLVAVVVRALT